MHGANSGINHSNMRLVFLCERICALRAGVRSPEFHMPKAHCLQAFVKVVQSQDMAS